VHDGAPALFTVKLFGLPMLHISGDELDQFAAPTASDLTPADFYWWEILKGIVC
jgi:hypothetical protein